MASTLMNSYASDLPAFCEPENDFLYQFSATFHTCVPTKLAFISTLLGTLSIVSWLFAQLPQVYKNYKLKSTSGLSIIFLGEWLLGDAANLVGSLLTQQATWQIIIAFYYCFVDCCLVGQYIWYEKLKHGRPLRSVYARWKSTDKSDGREADTLSIASTSGNSSTQNMSRSSSPRPIQAQQRSLSSNMFNTPDFSRSPSVMDVSSGHNTPTNNRHITRLASSSSPMPSPRTVLFISLLLAVLARASPLDHKSDLTATSVTPSSLAAQIGKISSWASTVLYLGSRLPQLYKNHQRKSTAGLSLALFTAAFFGNLFYASSMLTNPCAWESFDPSRSSTSPFGASAARKGLTNGSNESGGWAPQGSNKPEWLAKAAPFFFGAAGVLFTDAAVGVQFWYFGSDDSADTKRHEVVVVVESDSERVSGRGSGWRWRRVSGWMRGWVPSVAAVGRPVTREGEGQEENRGLLNGNTTNYGAA